MVATIELKLPDLVASYPKLIDAVPCDRHLTVAWRRNYTDITPLKGVIYTGGGTDELKVEVDVIRL